MNDTFVSLIAVLILSVVITSIYAFLWLLKRGNHDELFPIAILCLGIPPLGVLILFLTFLDGYYREKEQPG